MLKKALYAIGLLCFVIPSLTGCALNNVPVTVTSFNNPYINKTTYKRFTFTQIDELKQTPDQHLLEITKKVLEGSGFVYDSTSPEFIVSVQSSNEPIKLNENADKKASSVVSKKVRIIFGDYLYAKMIWQGEATSLYESGKVDLEQCILMGLLQSYPNKYTSVTKSVKGNLCKVD